MRVERAGESGERRAGGEGGTLQAAHRESHQVGDAFIIAHRRDADAKARMEKRNHQHDDRHRKGGDHGKADVRRHRIARGAAHHIEIQDRGLHNLV